jgi:hypothetical protein
VDDGAQDPALRLALFDDEVQAVAVGVLADGRVADRFRGETVNRMVVAHA